MSEPHEELHAFRQILRELVRGLEKEQAVSGCCCGLSFAQCHPLLEIERRSGATVVELAAALDLDKSTLSRTVADLVKLGLVERLEDPADRRLRPLRLTRQGRETIRAIDAKADVRFGRVLTAIPPAAALR